jgi:hypothetical protein
MTTVSQHDRQRPRAIAKLNIHIWKPTAALKGERPAKGIAGLPSSSVTKQGIGDGDYPASASQTRAIGIRSRHYAGF